MDMTIQQLKERFKAHLGLEEATKEDSKTVYTKDGELALTIKGDDVFIVDDQGEEMIAPDATYTLEDDTEMEVKEGKVVAVEEEEAKVEDEEAKEEDEMTEEVFEEVETEEVEATEETTEEVEDEVEETEEVEALTETEETFVEEAFEEVKNDEEEVEEEEEDEEEDEKDELKKMLDQALTEIESLKAQVKNYEATPVEPTVVPSKKRTEVFKSVDATSSTKKDQEALYAKYRAKFNK